ncbi:hypothetical protein Leryth_024567 [Lithospermum erythrorhizon]|nr:hypothetical protein Leryth_024567 [Lithospermum erythrorhizon]
MAPVVTYVKSGCSGRCTFWIMGPGRSLFWAGIDKWKSEKKDLSLRTSDQEEGLLVKPAYI